MSLCNTPQAIPDAHSLWHTTFRSIAHGISDPLFFLFPFFDHPWLVWMFPARQLEHHKVNEMAALLERVIAKKKAEMEEGGNVDNEHGERDLLSMLIEANEIEKRGEEGKGLSDRELRVSSLNICLEKVIVIAFHPTYFYSLPHI
ncbi:hypothetical protein BC938DRAFT_482589 [Jimgerdemannia flammicorona]|uniref:Cytochrome P450 n=1 Tax=Jimgerdemannia flammicorona TaxID=994334 RepID=A0A433QDN5_9FUNG|nr:hypothetical protein BC938DRAFT_482589 [Jimgerdemannia flammicorona]